MAKLLSNQLSMIYNQLKPMIISAELITNCPQFVNQHNQRQLDLRGLKINNIENLIPTLNYFQCIDFSDNDIKKLMIRSYLDRLNTLILTNNRVKTIADLSFSLPNLENLFLLNNKISDISEVQKLASCSKLKRLVLVNNPVTGITNYRWAVISKLTGLKVLDFKQVTAKERRMAANQELDEFSIKK